MLPKQLLYSIFARIGGSGLDTDAFEALRASYRGGFLGKAIAYDNRQKEIPRRFIHSLRWHPVRLISFLDRPYYYGAKKEISRLDRVAAFGDRALRFFSQLVGRLFANIARGEKEKDSVAHRDSDLASR